MSKRKMHGLIIFIILLLSVQAYSQQPWNEHGRLIVPEDNPHYLKYADGTPFFWLGDTGWELLHRLSREETAYYLNNRKEKGFNVIQTVLISEFIHSDRIVNYYSDSIFVDENPGLPAITEGKDPADSKQYDYWDHVDFVVQSAEEMGIYMALLPTWGEWVIPRSGKALFNTTQQAYDYGWFLGDRYKSHPNIIWILGGDRHPDEREGGADLWRAMAEGIADGVNREKNFDLIARYHNTLMSHHAFNSSSTWFRSDDWIDFYMWGSYHAEIDNPRSFEAALRDWNLDSPKPTLNAEPCYEGHGINYAIDDNGYFTSVDVRIAAYWSVFSGCMGFTYGSQPVWQFTDETRPKHSLKTLIYWKEGLDLPGAFQLSILKKLMEDIPMQDLKPDQSMLKEPGSCGHYTPVLRTDSQALVYIPTGKTTAIRFGILQGSKIKATWLDPRNGIRTPAGDFINSGDQFFEVPGISEQLTWLRSGRGCDWVLILEGYDN